jgi:hypothetical protein
MPSMTERAMTRIRGEYLEMPGLRLTLEQAQRLCGVERDLCRTVLEVLVESRFLAVRPDGRYVRVVDDDATRPQAVASARVA